MGTPLPGKHPCPNASCGSSDGVTHYKEGYGKCYVCEKSFSLKTPHKKGEQEGSMEEHTFTAPEGCTTEYLPWRGLTRETMAFYQVGTKVSPEGEPLSIGFHYPGGGIKLRAVASKEFISKGPISEPGLFGQDRFPVGRREVTITEGELDAMSAYQMLGDHRPCVSIRGASSAAGDCKKVFEYLNSFDKIVLCLDNDDPGKKAAREIASLFDFNKVYSVNLEPFKDANEFLQKGKEREFRNAWFGARRYLPEGIVSSLSDFRDIIADDGDKPSIPYPFGPLQEKTLGIRTGEFVLVTAPEGIGKTEFIRRIEHHLMVSTSVPIGCIHLEETKARQLKGLAGIELQAPAHLPDGNVSHDEITSALEKLTGGADDRLHIYSHFGSDDPDILLDAIRFMVTSCGCKYVFLDHITMIVTGLENDDERRTLDYLSTKLATMCHDLDFTLFCISHVNDDGKTRGSRNISKVANLRIDLSRNLIAELEEDRNKTYLTVSKNRYAGKTGPAGILAFDTDAFMLREAHEVQYLPPAE